MRGWQNNIAPAQGIPGSVRTCPVCGCTLANSEMGANSHLRMHIRRGEIAREDEQRLRQSLLHRPYRPNKAVREFLAEIGRKGGKIGGKSTSKAKAEASRRNGRLAAERRKDGKTTADPDNYARRA